MQIYVIDPDTIDFEWLWPVLHQQLYSLFKVFEYIVLAPSCVVCLWKAWKYDIGSDLGRYSLH